MEVYPIMKVKAYHRTKELESILNDKAVYSHLRVGLRGLSNEKVKKLQDIALKEYQEITQDMASLAQEHKKRIKPYLTKHKQATIEEVADVVEQHGLAESSKSIEYRELRRKYFVWLGNYETALQSVGMNYHILEFQIPKEKIRQGRNGILVWWELGLDHLTGIFTSSEKIEETKQLLKGYGIQNMQVRKFLD